ncbi:MAG: RagB/SusD family nutrient uptake outer membrane protein, partial [Flavobacteriaceae bacterium]|nr:RagB/SusD family nutrient uptake outer membrane protein [Flavobacteriaceae bacterium]
MILKNIKYLFFGLFITLAYSCSEDFIEVDPKDDNPLEASYYRNESEAFSGLVAVYDVIGKESK